MSTYVVDYVQPIAQPMESLQGHFTQLVASHRDANVQLRSQTQELVSTGAGETFQGEGAKAYSDLVNYYLTTSEKHLQVLEDSANAIKTSHSTIMDATYSASSANLHDGLTNKVLTQVTHDQIIQQGSEPIWAVVNEMLSTLNDMKNTAGSFFGDLVSFHFGDALGALGHEFSDAGQLVGEITSLLQDIGRVLGQWASEVSSAVGRCLQFLGSAVVGLLDFVTGFSSMVNDIKTLFNGKASLLDKLLAAGDLVLNAGMDILMVTGIGEGLRAGELAIKGGIEIAKGFGRDAIEQGVKDVAEQGSKDVVEQGVRDGAERGAGDGGQHATTDGGNNGGDTPPNEPTTNGNPEWGDHDPSLRAELQDKANGIRQENNLTSRTALRRNLGFADYNIGGDAGEVKAYSSPKHIDGFVDMPASGEEHFTAIPDSPNPDGSPGNPRTSDTEYKILENIADKHWSNDPAERASVNGDVNLYTERQPCPSCTDVIRQFREAFPNIRLHVEWSIDTPR